MIVSPANMRLFFFLGGGGVGGVGGEILKIYASLHHGRWYLPVNWLRPLLNKKVLIQHRGAMTNRVDHNLVE